MKNLSIEGMSENQAKTLLHEISEQFGIGSKVPAHVLKTNIGNCIRFTEKLHAVEREFFMVDGPPDEDYPDDKPEDECLVNSWAAQKMSISNNSEPLLMLFLILNNLY